MMRDCFIGCGILDLQPLVLLATDYLVKQNKENKESDSGGDEASENTDNDPVSCEVNLNLFHGEALKTEDAVANGGIIRLRVSMDVNREQKKKS